jgi:hypothetical protein
VREPQGHVADQLVANVVTKGVIDVLEVIEIDVKYGGRCTPVLDFLDHRLQTLAKKNPIGKAAQGVVHREMAQPRFAGSDRRRGAPHVAQYERREQRESD